MHLSLYDIEMENYIDLSLWAMKMLETKKNADNDCSNFGSFKAQSNI